MMQLALIFMLECFNQNTAVTFLVGPNTLTLQAQYNQQLSTDEEATCKILDNQKYIVYVYVGDLIFLQESTFKHNSSVSLTLHCQDSSCTYDNIKDYSVCTYKIQFLQSSYILQGIAYDYSIRWYDKTACFDKAHIEYDIANAQNLVHFFQTPNSMCRIKPEGDQLYIETLVNKQILQDEKKTLSGFSITDQSQLTTFTYSCAVGDQVCNDFIYQQFDTTTAAAQTILKSTIKITKGADTFLYNESIAIDYDYVQSILDKYCFTDVQVKLTKQNVQFQFTKNIAGQSICTDALLKSYFPDQSEMVFYYTFAENQDQSGSFYQMQFKFEQPFLFNTNMHFYVECKQTTDQQKCQEFLDNIVEPANNNQIKSNTSHLLNILVYKQDKYFNNVLLNRYEFEMNFILTQYSNIIINVYSQEICFNIDSNEAGVKRVTLDVNKQFILQQYNVNFQLGQFKECSSIEHDVQKKFKSLDGKEIEETLFQIDGEDYEVTSFQFYIEAVNNKWLILLVCVLLVIIIICYAVILKQCWGKTSFV